MYLIGSAMLIVSLNFSKIRMVFVFASQDMESRAVRGRFKLESETAVLRELLECIILSISDQELKEVHIIYFISSNFYPVCMQFTPYHSPSLL